MVSGGGDSVVANGADDFRAVEEALTLLRRQPVPDVRIVEDLRERTPALVLAKDVRADAVLGGRAREQKRERVAQKLRKPPHEAIVSLRSVRQKPAVPVYAEREVHGFDDTGAPERILIWIERRPGGIWAVGRVVNPQHRPSNVPRPDDYVFEGWDVEDALEQANEVLEDDVAVSEEDGLPEHVRPFVKEELLRPLERWFFGHAR